MTKLMRILLPMAAICLSCPALADKLPSGSKPMSSSEIRSIYSGKTANWHTTKMYFAADGKAKGYTTKKTATMEGTWSVSGNRICMYMHWKAVKGSKHGKGTDCWDWYSDAKGPWTLWSKRYTHDKPKADEYYRGETKVLRKGDGVSAEYAKLVK